MSSGIREYNLSWPDEIRQSPEDVQKQIILLKECEIDRRELELRKEQDALKDQRIANLEKELELAHKESALKDKMLEIKDQEIASTRRSLENMEKVADRAIKLAETSKPKSNWQLQGLLGLAAFFLGLFAGK